jgi:hypothetical protein
MVTVKSIFYKFCFCLGLGTASYYSYAQVTHWVKGDDQTVSSNATAFGLQDKVEALTQNEVLTPEQRQAQIVARMAHQNSFVMNPNASVTLSGVKPLAAPVAEASPADPNASPSPSPGEGEAKKDDEKKDGEKKEGEEAKTAENGEGAPVDANLPIAQPFMMPNGQPYPEAMMAAQPQAQTSSDSNSNTPTGMPAGFNSYAAGNTGSGYGNGNSGSNSGSGYGGTNYTNNGTATSTTSALTQDDLNTLTAPVQAAFQDQQNHVSGYACADTSHSSCTYQSDVAVHSLRWGREEGLEQNVNFAVKAGSGATPVQFDVSFKIQDRLLNDQTVALTAQPSQVLVHSESRDSKTYRVYEFKMPDTTVRSDDQLTDMQATLVYEVTPTGMVMSPDSKFTFSRDQVTTNAANWDPSTQQAPIQNELYFVADELPYSMSLQKSP